MLMNGSLKLVAVKKTNGTTSSSSSSATFQAKTRPLINTKSSTCTTFTSTCHKVITTSRPITSSNVTLKSLPTIVQSKKSLPSKPNHITSSNLVRTASSPSLHKIPSGKTIHRSHSKVELKGKSRLLCGKNEIFTFTEKGISQKRLFHTVRATASKGLFSGI